MSKMVHKALGLAEPTVDFSALQRAQRRVAKTGTEEAARSFAVATPIAWWELCNRLLVTRNRDDRQARSFEEILSNCQRDLRRLLDKQPSWTVWRHEARIALYLWLVRRFRREGLGGVTAGLSEILNENRFSDLLEQEAVERHQSARNGSNAPAGSICGNRVGRGRPDRRRS